MEFNVQRSEDSILTLLVASKGRLMLFVPNLHVLHLSEKYDAPSGSCLQRGCQRRPSQKANLDQMNEILKTAGTLADEVAWQLERPLLRQVVAFMNLLMACRITYRKTD